MPYKTKMKSIILAALTLCFLLIPSPKAALAGENWPGWRGPRGDGTSLDKEVPVRWDVPKGEGLLWKVPLPGSGHAAPVIWDERIFIAACNEESKERTLACLDRATGKTLWQKTVFRGPLESKHPLNSFASSTPATDGKLVFVSFLEVDGSLIPGPQRRHPSQHHPRQNGRRRLRLRRQPKMARPARRLHQRARLLRQPSPLRELRDRQRRPRRRFLHRRPRQSRPARPSGSSTGEHKTRSYVTPLIREIDGRTQMVLSGSKHILSVDPRDGSRHWMIEGPTEQFVASMVYDGKLFFMAAGYPDLSRHGASAPTAAATSPTRTSPGRQPSRQCYVPSPIVVNGYLLVADDRGTVNCFAAATGERLWQERLGTHFSTSAVTAGGLVYLIADDGRTKVIRPSPKLETLADNPLGEPCYSSPAFAHNRLYIRGEKHLFCIGK